MKTRYSASPEPRPFLQWLNFEFNFAVCQWGQPQWMCGPTHACDQPLFKQDGPMRAVYSLIHERQYRTIKASQKYPTHIIDIHKQTTPTVKENTYSLHIRCSKPAKRTLNRAEGISLSNLTSLWAVPLLWSIKFKRQLSSLCIMVMFEDRIILGRSAVRTLSVFNKACNTMYSSLPRGATASQLSHKANKSVFWRHSEQCTQGGIDRLHWEV